jgi:hypothetical protein
MKTTFDFVKLLEKLTNTRGWYETDGPESRCGVDYWYAVSKDYLDDYQEAYINIDQTAITIEVNGEVVFQTDDYTTDEFLKPFIIEE